MAMTDQQKIIRYELENKAALTPQERLMLAALNDLRMADDSGKNLEEAKQSVKDAEKDLAKEREGKLEEEKKPELTGGEDVKRVKMNQE